MARRRKGRPIDGILIFDKPLHASSNRALQTVKRLYGAAKAGHTGSLDPLASGVLPLCFGEATKFSSFLLDADKQYLSTFILGKTTATGDAEGDVLSSQGAASITESVIEEALTGLRGSIEQVPSMYSAIKVDGQPLYKLARKGQEIERKARKVEIHRFDVLEFRPGEYAEIDVDIRCSKGTYVRSLAEDLGALLGCGAYVSALRRTAAGPFELGQSVTMEGLESCLDREGLDGLDSLLMPTDAGLTHLPELILDDNSAHYLCHGQAVLVPKAPTDGLVRIAGECHSFLGIGEILDDGRVAPRRLVVTQ